ncbi:TetR/AcrR family transcriptional regulator [Streptomyces beijiangensis]|uniref:TetR family transcriptional regulator n=1 Tax=Streptomyces beijiangensis TaxID=163361 RepID=A0A939JIP4_9ACTN|nr:TetR family transcriptional regulator [Streptomyces beijiangensis]MBO0515733.1 TetR family transcriptional regulator [Streptomyces beijiangensis]
MCTMAATTPQPGLRERKKIKTRTEIRRATYALIAEQGYDATTVEQIAEAAEVSPSTVFRYFPTKEDIVLTDEYDPLLARELRARPAGEPVLESLRYVIAAGVRMANADESDADEMRQRTALMVSVPALRSRMMESMSVSAHMICEILAERCGRESGDLEIRAYTMAVMGALHETTVYWAEHGHQDDLVELVDRTLNTLRDGLPV